MKKPVSISLLLVVLTSVYLMEDGYQVRSIEGKAFQNHRLVEAQHKTKSKPNRKTNPERATITVYSDWYHQKLTRSGERYNKNGLTAACDYSRFNQLNQRRLTVVYGKRTVTVKINDSLSPSLKTKTNGLHLDLSKRAWNQLTSSAFPSKLKGAKVYAD